MNIVSRCLPFFILLLPLSAGSGQQRGLQVVVASPQGAMTTIDQSQTIFITFNQPMTPLEAVSTQDGSALMQIEPKIPGKFRWMGTTTLAFLPAAQLPNATGYTVHIAPGTKSLSGLTLPEGYSWKFETPRPRILRTIPNTGQKFVELDHSMLIQFNQPVDPQVVSQYISIIQLKGSEQTFPQYVAMYPDRKVLRGDSTTAILLRAKEPFKKGATITVRCRAGITGKEGPLGTQADFSFSFSTYDELTFNGVSSDRNFDPGYPLKFLFSNPVAAPELASHLWFDPAVQIRVEDYENWYVSPELRMTLPLQAETAYRGVVKAGLKDRFGNILPSDAPFAFRTTSFKPYVRMTTGPGVIEAYESHKYPVTFMNKDSVRVQMGKVNPDRIVELMQRLNFSYFQTLAMEEGILLWPDSRSEEAAEFTRSTIWHIKAPRNARTVKPLDFDAVLGPSKTGLVFAQVDNLEEKDHRYLKTLVQTTNMGITAKFSPETNLIWVTNLKDATPVVGARVEIRTDSNKVVWTGTTDSRGITVSPGWGKLQIATPDRPPETEGEEDYYDGGTQPRQWVIVTQGNDIAFTNSTWNEGIQPWAFGVAGEWNPQPMKFEGSLFTDRGLYKAGEQVEIKGVVRVRKEGDWRIERNAKLLFSIRDSRNEEVYSGRPALSPFGSFALSFPLKPSASLGGYSMTLKLQKPGKGKPRWENVGGGGFSVEAFRAAEFEVTGRTDRKEYIIGDSVSAFLSARYLFGAPLKKASVQWRLSVTPSGWAPPGYDGYFFESLRWLTRYERGPGYRLLSSEPGTLDDVGSISMKTALGVGEIRGTSSLMVEGDVTSPSRQVISGRATAIVHGGEFAIGIRPKTTFLQTDSALAFNIVAVSLDGKPLPGQSLGVKIIQRVWNSVRKAETGGRYTWVSEEADSIRDSSRVTTESGPLERIFVPKRPGLYYIEAEGKDARGNQILSQSYFYVCGSGYVPWDRPNDDRIELIADKNRYSPGDIAHILVKSPYESAPALISLEREGIIQHYTRRLVGSAPQLDIPVTKEMLPNIFVSVVLLQGRVAPAGTSKEGDIGKPSFKVGYVDIPVSPAEQELKVILQAPRGDFRPGDTVEVSLNVHDATGKGVRSEVALSVADLGVLNLINYRLPNLFHHFYRARPLAVTTTETRMHLVEQRDYGEKGEDEGGGGVEDKRVGDVDAEGMRKDFRPSAYWNPSLQTDSAGMASVRFKLPDNLTAFQAMAVALTRDSKFGYGDLSFTVSKTLLLQPSLPRFARVGDAFEAGVVVMNHSGVEKSVTVTASARGIVMSGIDSSVHVLAPGQAKEVRYSFRAEKVGKAVVTFRVRAGNESDGLQWSFPVTVPRLRESVALYESTVDERVEESLVPPDSIYREISDVEVTAASTAMVRLSGGLEYLFSYPYYCLEQRCSSVLPLILARDLVEAFHFEVSARYREAVVKVIDELPMFQRYNGGFSYWKNTERTWPYISAYAVYTLIQAKNKGYPVDEKSLGKAIAYLQRVLNGSERATEYSDLASRCTRALILYDLALAGKPDHAYMATLYNERAMSPLFARAYLLKALHRAGGDAGMQNELVRDLINQAKVAPKAVHFEEPRETGLEWIYHSTARTTALVLQAIIETQPESPLIPKTVRWLLDRQKTGCWRTTQENIYVIDALATYFKAYEEVEPNFRATVTVGGKAILDELFAGRSMKTATGRISMMDPTIGRPTPVTIAKSGPGRVYYGVRMNYYPQGAQPPKEEGLSVSKTIDVEDSQHDLKAPFSAGTIARITLTVLTNQARNFIVLDDPVPAGFEIINSSFQTVAVTGGDDSRRRSSWAFQHAEKYDDHVLVFADYLPSGIHTFTYDARVVRTGDFQMPATRVEGMYEPEVFGQNASAKILVK
jgi:alpha-2-macroglobulin